MAATTRSKKSTEETPDAESIEAQPEPQVEEAKAKPKEKSSKKLCPYCGADLSDQYDVTAARQDIRCPTKGCDYSTDHWTVDDDFVGLVPVDNTRETRVYGQRARSNDHDNGDISGGDAA